MANPWERAEPLFRFVQVRAPKITRPSRGSALPRIRAYFPDAPTVFHKALRAGFAASSTNDMVAAAAHFMHDSDRSGWAGSQFRGTAASIDEWLSALDDLLISAASKF